MRIYVLNEDEVGSMMANLKHGHPCNAGCVKCKLQAMVEAPHLTPTVSYSTINPQAEQLGFLAMALSQEVGDNARLRRRVRVLKATLGKLQGILDIARDDDASGS